MISFNSKKNVMVQSCNSFYRQVRDDTVKNHRMAEVGDTSGDHLLQLSQLRAGSARADHPGFCAVRFLIAPGTETPPLP